MTQVCTGSFLSTVGTPYFIPLQQYVSEFRIKNLTYSGVTVGSTSGVLTSTKIVEAFKTLVTTGMIITGYFSLSDKNRGVFSNLNVSIVLQDLVVRFF